MRVVLAASVAVAAFPTTALAAELTPAGRSTLMSEWTGPSTLEGRVPEVLVAARVEVAAGGGAGGVRIRARDGGVNAAGDRVLLPSEPGTYMLSAPHIRWDYRSGQLGLDQEEGGHAILQQNACDPTLGQGGDPCQLMRVNIFTPPGGDGTPSEVRRGAKLTMTGVVEPDRDQDFLGDTTEDRTDLRVSAAPARDADGRLRVTVTVTNTGPLAADLPALETTVKGAEWDGCKPNASLWYLVGFGCGVARLAAGESRTLTLTADAPDALTATVAARAEGPDLSGADNTATLAVPAAPAFDLTAAERQRLTKGVKVQVRGVRAGRARVTLAFKVGERTVKVGTIVKLAPYAARSVTVRATGAKLRSLKRAVKRGPLSAEITVRTLRGTSPVTARTTVLR
jgi:hypothetical protein